MKYEEDEELEKGSDIDRVRTILADEEDGSRVLDQIINDSSDPRVKEVFEAIKEDEQKHVAALQQLAEILGSDAEEGEDEGEDEGMEEDEPEPESEPEDEGEGEEEYDYAEGDVPADLDLDNAPESDLSVDLGNIPDDEEEEDEELDKEENPTGDLIDDIREVLEEHETEKGEDEPESEGDEEDKDDDEDLPEFLKSEDGEPEDGEDDMEKRCHKSITAQFIAKSADQQIVYGVVSEPGTIDLQGDRLSESEIRKACHSFMMKSQKIGKEHTGPAKADIIESYIAPVDFTCGGQKVRKGSWVMACKIHDPDIWQAVKKGEITGYSIAGTGTRTPF